MLCRIIPSISSLVIKYNEKHYKLLVDSLIKISSLKIKRGKKIDKIKNVLFKEEEISFEDFKMLAKIYCLEVNNEVAKQSFEILNNIISHLNSKKECKKYIKEELNKWISYDY